MDPKEFKEYLCLCQNKCHDKVSAGIRKKEFLKFWELGTYDAQTAYIGAVVRDS